MPHDAEPRSQLTARIPAELHRRLKAHTAASGVTVTDFLVVLLREALPKQIEVVALAQTGPFARVRLDPTEAGKQHNDALRLAHRKGGRK